MKKLSSTLLKVLAMLTLLSFLSAILVVKHRVSLIWTGILFFISSYVAYYLLYTPDKEENNKGRNTK